MFLRRIRPRQNAVGRATHPQRQERRQTKKRKPNKDLLAALEVDVMRDEYFVDPTPEEAAEVTRILEAKNYFEVLELNHKDDLDEKEDELRQSYLRKVVLLNSHISSHPRMTEAFTKLSQAYDVLSDPILRLEHKYDQYGGRPNDPLGAVLQLMFEDEEDMMGAPMGFMPPMAMAPQGQRMIRPPQMIIRRPQRDPFLDFFGSFINALEGPRRTQPARRPSPVPVQARRGSNNSDESELDDFERDIARLFFGPTPIADPAERRRRQREEQRRLRIERQRLQQEAEQERQEAGEENRNIDIGDLMRMMLGGMPRQPRQERNEPVRVFGPGNIRFVNRRPDGSQPPVARATPVEPAAAPTPVQRAASGNQLRRQRTADLEQNLQTLLGMGFSEEDSLRALDLANGNVEHAVTLLLS